MAAITGAITLDEARRHGNLTGIDATLYDRFKLAYSSRDGFLNFYDVWPMQDQPGSLKYKARRVLSLPEVAPRALNEDVSPTKGQIEEFEESFSIYDTDTPVDIALMRTNAGGQIVADQVNLHTAAILQRYMRDVFKGDQFTNPKEPQGLYSRLTGEQLVANSASSGGGALSIAKLRQMIERVNGANKVLFMCGGLSLRFDAAQGLAGIGGQISIGPSQFGERTFQFRGIPIVPVKDLRGRDNIPGFDEVGSGGGSAVTTSIICASLGEDGAWGLRNGFIASRMVAEGTAPAIRSRLLLLAGMALKTPEAAGRLSSITDAAIVA